ncbi:MAG: ASKHA domain-containing protein [Desulfobacteraceae bacterium]|nr:ASKHA domain-containing protein [Desulfobacteraceae bacterium]MCF8095863.1 ASKHA domain-containing protein [Desulfobacteraceae bacterium]
MAEIRIIPENISVRTRRGETVRDALYRAGIELETPCSGEGVCGKCLIRVDDPENVPETPHKEISEEQAAQGLRLACRLAPKTDIAIQILSEFCRDEHRILEGDRDPAFSEWESGSEGRGAAKPHLDDSEPRMRNVPAVAVDCSDGGCRMIYDGQTARELDPWQPGATPMGLAIDLGTTTLVVSLIDLSSGGELTTTSSLNPQIRFGHDVVRRIQKGSTTEGLEELSGCVRKGLNRLIEQACEDSGVDPMQVLDVVIGGNTTMLQLAAAVDPEPLGRVPFSVGLESGRTYPASRFGLNVHPAARVYVPPVLHAYVGADISAGLLVSRRFFGKDGAMLFVDIGTNGEMGLSASGRYVMTSTAAGPAFEGMGISAGMRARIGAVEAVTTDGSGSFKIHTIGNAPAEGICGSGIIDITAALLQLGVIDATGRMLGPDRTEGLRADVAERIEKVNDMPAFRLGKGVYFTQQDVRQVQLAKSAIRAAIEILLQEAEIGAGTLDRIVLAGGFGYSLRSENLETIGLLPPGTAEKVYFAGNTSRIGCVRMLRNIGYRRFLEEKMGAVRHVSIESRPDFMEQYVASMEFPEPGELQ